MVGSLTLQLGHLQPSVLPVVAPGYGLNLRCRLLSASCLHSLGCDSRNLVQPVRQRECVRAGRVAQTAGRGFMAHIEPCGVVPSTTQTVGSTHGCQSHPKQKWALAVDKSGVELKRRAVHPRVATAQEIQWHLLEARCEHVAKRGIRTQLTSKVPSARTRQRTPSR